MNGPDGFQVFLEQHSPSLLRSAVLLTGSHHTGEDLLQECLAIAYRRWDDIIVNPAAYVRTTMVRQQSAWWRRKWRGEIPTEELPETTDTSSDSATERLLLRRALAQLPLAQRQVVVLRYVDDLSLREVAELTGRPPGTVKSQCARGLERLRGRGAQPAPSGRRGAGRHTRALPHLDFGYLALHRPGMGRVQLLPSAARGRTQRMALRRRCRLGRPARCAHRWP